MANSTDHQNEIKELSICRSNVMIDVWSASGAPSNLIDGNSVGATGGNEIISNYCPPTSCCYEFRVRAGKRVTNGYTGPGWADYDFQTISLRVP